MSEREYHLDFSAGVIAERRTGIGRTPEVQGHETAWGECPHLAQLRVGWRHPENVAERWVADLYVNSIGPIGPIDLPFVYNVEQPIEITVRPLAAPSSPNQVLLLLADLPNPPNLYGATYLAIPDESGYVQIPPWVVGVTIYGLAPTCYGTFYDLTPAAIGDCVGNQFVARPRWATQLLLVGTGAAVLFHY